VCGWLPLSAFLSSLVFVWIVFFVFGYCLIHAMSIPCLYLVRVCSVVSPCFWFIMGCYTANLRSKHGFGMALLCRDGLLILYNNVFLFASFYVFKKKFVLDCFHLQRFKLNLVLFFKKIVSIVWIVL
jgi:hypothetical protein